MRGLSPVAASGGHSSSRCAGLSLSWPLLLRSTRSRCADSVIVAHGPSCSAACGIFPDQGSNPCALHWQADSQPLRHQGSPRALSIARILTFIFCYISNHCHPDICLSTLYRPSSHQTYLSLSFMASILRKSFPLRLEKNYLYFLLLYDFIFYV